MSAEAYRPQIAPIIITEPEPGHFTIAQNGRSVLDLCADEAMAQIVRLLSPAFPGFPMLTDAEREALKAEREARMHAAIQRGSEEEPPP